jgi:hypothetical protein
VTVEGAQGSVPIPVQTFLEDRRTSDWTGHVVFLGAISTTVLSDGPQRLRVTGGYREYEIDGDPTTPAFEPGGASCITFDVANGRPQPAPPR